MKIRSLFLIAVLAFSLPLFSKTSQEKTIVYFNTTDHSLNQAAKNKLDQLFQKSKLQADFEIFIEGHTDDRGSVDFNNQLSLNRSESVKAYLLEKGIPERMVTIRYRGELSPTLPNTSDKNRETNRRVEVLFTTYQFGSLEELEKELGGSGPQIISIDPRVENRIDGKKGIRLLIPENAFRFSNGKLVQENINIELTEALSYTDFIASGLETKSGNKLLESGGMLKVVAKSRDGQNLRLDNGKKILLAVPDKNRKENMEVFLSESGNNWTSSKQKITKDVSILDVRPYPKMKTKLLALPTFKYGVEPPKAPQAPAKVQNPHKPKEVSYKRPIPWYKLNKKKIRERQKRNYKTALIKYDKKMERYARLQVSYEKKRNAYEKTYAQYERAMQCWREDENIAEAEFKNTPKFQDALAKRNKMHNFYKNNHQLAVDKWKAERKLSAMEYGKKMDRMGIANEEGMQNYIFAINELSWVNVDRFYKIAPSEKQLVEMHTKDASNEKVLILFKDINSMLSVRPNEEGNAFLLDNFPKKEEAFIFAYKVENNRPMIFYKEMDGSQEYQLNYEESSFTEIKDILKRIESS